jgi:hypothetical protein
MYWPRLAQLFVSIFADLHIEHSSQNRLPYLNIGNLHLRSSLLGMIVWKPFALLRFVGFGGFEINECDPARSSRVAWLAPDKAQPEMPPFEIGCGDWTINRRSAAYETEIRPS